MNERNNLLKFQETSSLPEPGLRIRLIFPRIRIQPQILESTADPDPDSDPGSNLTHVIKKNFD